MVKSSITSITPAQHADKHLHGGTDPLVGDVRIDGMDRFDTMTLLTRTTGTIYQNTSDHTIFLSILVNAQVGSGIEMFAHVKSVSPPDTLIQRDYAGAGKRFSFSFMVPPGYYYRIQRGGGVEDSVIWYQWE